MTFDKIAPTASAPISTAQSLQDNTASTSTVSSNEDGDIYLVKNGVAVTTQAEINAAIAAKNAFLGKSSATASIGYTITTPDASLINEGDYDIVAVDLAGNVSSAASGWLNIDYTAPSKPGIPDLAASSDSFSGETGSTGTNSDNVTNDNTPLMEATAHQTHQTWH